MNKNALYINKIIKKRQEERILYFHRQNLNSVRPLNGKFVQSIEPLGQINNKKKQMMMEDKFTQIQRQNRMLLQKINFIMNKKSSFKEQIKHKKSQQKQRMNKSLNQGFRRKQLEDIQVQNAKMLKRLQQKKSDYQAQKLKQQWKKQKSVIKNLVNFPFIIRDKIIPKRRKSMTSHSLNNQYLRNEDLNSFKSPIQLVRIRNFNNNSFIINLKYLGDKLQITGQNRLTKQIKLIQINKQEAIEFIHYECDGKIQNIFQRLQYDDIKKVLYLVGKGVDLNAQNQQEQTQNRQYMLHHKYISQKKMSKIYEEDTNKQDQSELQNHFNTNNKLINNQHQNQHQNQQITLNQNDQLQIDNQDQDQQPLQKKQQQGKINLEKELQKDIQKANQEHYQTRVEQANEFQRLRQNQSPNDLLIYHNLQIKD